MTDIISILTALTITIDPVELFNEVEVKRLSGELSKAVTDAKVVYQGSRLKEDLIEEIDRETGERRHGLMVDGFLNYSMIRHLHC